MCAAPSGCAFLGGSFNSPEKKELNVIKKLAGSVVLILLLVVTLPGAVTAGEETSMETLKKGKAAFDSQCMNCHRTVEEATSGYRKDAGWSQVVTDMIGLGAELDDDQQKAVVEYLSARSLLHARCRSCHSYNRPLTMNKSPVEWKRTVEEMRDKIPIIFKPGDVDRIANFLAVERPVK